MMDFKPLTYIYKPAGEPGGYTLLLLHGTGGNEHDLIPLAQNFGSKYNLLSVRGNVTENGMPRFFKRLGMGIFDEEDLHFRTDELAAFLQQVAADEGFDASKVIALGYSNGANIAGAVLAKYPSLLAGVILYRPMQPFKAFKVDGPAIAPVFFSSGRLDPTVNPADTQEYLKILSDSGFKVSFHELPTGHNLTQQDVALSAKWLNSNF